MSNKFISVLFPVLLFCLRCSMVGGLFTVRVCALNCGWWKEQSESESCCWVRLFATPRTSAWNSPSRILQWIAFPFPRGSSQSKDQTQVSQMPVDSLPTEPQGKPTERTKDEALGFSSSPSFQFLKPPFSCFRNGHNNASTLHLSESM